MALWPGHQLRAIVSLMIATGGAASVSAAVKPRPDTSLILSLSRNDGLTPLTLATPFRFIVAVDAPSSDIAEVLAFIGGNEHFYLNLGMPTAKLAMDAARNVPGSSLVTVMARNGTEFGIQTAGCATVPVYPTLTGPQSAYILNDCAARVFITSMYKEEQAAVVGRESSARRLARRRGTNGVSRRATALLRSTRRIPAPAPARRA